MKQNLLLAGCLIIIGVLIALIFRPVPKPEIIGDLTPSQEKTLQSTIITLEDENDSLRNELTKSKFEGQKAEKVFKEKETVFKRAIAEQKAKPEVIDILEREPEIDSLIGMQDAALVFYQDRIDELTEELTQRDELNVQIQANLERRCQILSSFVEDKAKENEQLARQNRKLRHKLFWTKVGGVLVLVSIGALAL